MSLINTILGIPLGFVTYFAYRLTGSYGYAILIFAVAVRIMIFPVNVLSHKNAIRLLQLQPSLNIAKLRYAGDKERLGEEQYDLFKREKYSPFVGLIPLFIQLFLIIGMLQVMYHPLQHMLRFEQDVIEALVIAVRGIYGTQGSIGEQLLVIEALKQPEYLTVFQNALSGFPESGRILGLAADTDLYFLGVNLGEIPSFGNPTSALVVPFLSAFAALVFCLVQNVINPGALSQGKGTKYGFTVFTVAFSLYFAFVTPAGVGVYWTAGNVLYIAAVLILNVMYSPRTLAGEALAHIEASRRSPAQIRVDRKRNKELAEREKHDAALFRAAKKRLVFYALTGGQYKFYKNIIEYLLESSDIVIHYLTNDPEDAVFRQDNERLIPYYASQKKTISLMLRLDTDILATTVPDLQSFHIKRSIARDDIEYVYVFHTITSTHLTLREKALDHFDTLLCVGSHQTTELRRREELAGLPKRSLVKAGYGLYDQLLESYAALPAEAHEKPRVLIAPSWQADNILDICIDEMLDALLGRGYNITVRPHPQYTRLFPKRMNLLADRYAGYADNGELTFELDFSGNESIFSSDILITDWSNIAFEFSYCTLKPCIFINTPMKVMNPNYERYGLEVLDISLRDKVGVSVDVAGIGGLNDAVSGLLADKDAYREQIEGIVSQYIYHPGRNGEAGGRYIIKQLESATKELRKESE